MESVVGERTARGVLLTQGMSYPRQVLPGMTYLLTRRCTQRQFLLRPSAQTNAILLYCEAPTQVRFRKKPRPRFV